MTQSSTLNTRQARRITGPETWWADPFVWVFAALVIAAYVISSVESAEWLPGLLLIAVVSMACFLVSFVTRKQTPVPVYINRPFAEGWALLGWYIIFMAISAVTEGEVIFANEFGKWLWFIALPVFFVYLLRRRERSLKEILKSIGLCRRNLGKALLLALLAAAVTLTVMPFFMPEAQMQKLQELMQNPSKLLLIVPLSFGMALVTAATTEEVFFRGFLQTRLAVMMRSEVRGCLVAALLFGLYHLPYAYFTTSWPTHGNLVWAISSVIVEQAVTGLILGILWYRTRNLAAPVLFHALVNTLPIITMFN